MYITYCMTSDKEILTHASNDLDFDTCLERCVTFLDDYPDAEILSITDDTLL